MGAIERRRLTVFSTASIVKSTSSAVLPRPRPKRIDAWARSSGTPSAFKTCEGRSDADVQAEPEETATSRIPIRSSSPSTPAKGTLRLPRTRSSSRAPRPPFWVRGGAEASVAAVLGGGSALQGTSFAGARDAAVEPPPRETQPPRLALHLGHRDLDRPAETHDSRNVQRARPQAPLVA